MAHHLKPGQLYDDRERVSDGAIRRLARKCEPALLYRVARADCLGRTGTSRRWRWSGSWRRCRRSRWRSGRRSRCSRAATCWSWAWPPGPEVGRILRAVYERQLDGAVHDAGRGARAEARRLVGLWRAWSRYLTSKLGRDGLQRLDEEASCRRGRRP